MTIRPVKVVTASDLEENGGVYLVKKGVPAVPVWGFTNQGNMAVSSSALPVYVVTEAEFNAGDFAKAHGRPMRVGDIDDLAFVGALEGREAVPVWAVNDWPGGSGDDCDDMLDSEYCSVESQFSTVPSDTRRDAASDFFIAARTALGIATLSEAFDFLYLLCNEDADDALINLANPGTHNATNVNAVAFEASRGYTSNGSTSYLNTNFNPAVDGVNYLQNSASFGVYSRTDVNAAVVDMGARHSTSSRQAWMAARSSNAMSSNINQNSAVNTGANTVLDSRGLFVLSRTASNAHAAYRNGAKILDFVVTSSLPPDFDLPIGAINSNGIITFFTSSVRQYALAFAGRGMSDTEVADFYTAVQTFMAAIGAQV